MYSRKALLIVMITVVVLVVGLSVAGYRSAYLEVKAAGENAITDQTVLLRRLFRAPDKREIDRGFEEIAWRSDGTYVEKTTRLSSTGVPAIARTVWYPDGTKVVLDDSNRLKTTYWAGKGNEHRSKAASRPLPAEGCLASADGLPSFSDDAVAEVRRGSIHGYVTTVVRLESKEGNSHTFWLAPALNCAVIHYEDTFVSGEKNIAQLVEVRDRVSDQLYAIPPEYEEVSPVERRERVIRSTAASEERAAILAGKVGQRPGVQRSEAVYQESKALKEQTAYGHAAPCCGKSRP